jgi:hypothetical protein
MFSGSNPAAARSARAISGRLPILCRTLAWALFILVPRPAASISTLLELFTISSFHFPFAILHFSFVIARMIIILAMTNEKCNMANGK